MIYNWKIVGHEDLLTSLEMDMQSGNLAHAYLFSGPEKVGKYRVAKTLAHILQCENNFCHDCPTCLQIEKSGHADTIELADDGETIKIETVRELIVRLNMTTSAKYKIVLVEKIERLTLEAANCLLKTLEEPPEKTLFIFTTSSTRDVLPTIVSRMRAIQFHHCPEKMVREKIQEMYPESEGSLLDQVSSFAMGKPGVAFRLMRDPEMLAVYRRLYQDLLRFLDHSSVFERFCYVQEFIEDPVKIQYFLDILTHLVRIRLLEDPLNKERFIAILEKISFTIFALKHNTNPKLALEQLMLAL